MEPPSPASVTTTPETRNWAALPHDILLTIFLKLGPCEIMQGAELVCTTWRRVAVDEPALWRRVDMGTASPWARFAAAGSGAAARAAVARGAGQCEAFSGPCDDGLLLYLAERAPCLRSLHLSSFHGSNEILNLVLMKLPLLEDLEVSPSQSSNTLSDGLFESTCQACPFLKKLTIRFSNVPVRHDYVYGDNLLKETIKGEIPMMSELLSLELFDCYLSSKGLTTILDYCPLLESLHIEGCFYDEMDADLRGKCARVKDLTLPNGSDEDYELDEDYEWDRQFYKMYCESWDYERWATVDNWGMDYHPQYYYLGNELHYDI
ncbi:hypothetical protein EJB05_52422, partial [Eragrostis curvula]